MKKFNIVFNFELKSMIKKKSTIVSTILMSLIILLISSVPSFMVWFSKDSSLDKDKDIESRDEINIVYQGKEMESAFSKDFGKPKYDSEKELRRAIEDKKIDSGFIINDYNRYTYITYDSDAFSQEQISFEEKLKRANEELLFREQGIDSIKVYEIIERPIESESITLGKDAGSGMQVGFFFVLVMYMLIILYGTTVATSVAREKDSRTMELLITSTKPKTLILGKVAATGLVGILQVFILLLSLYIGFLLNKTNYPDFILDMIKGKMTIDTALVFILFSVLGYTLYLFIYASLGSLVSKVEDVNSAVTPITMLFIAAYFVANLAMQMPENVVVRVTSFIPFVSIFTMPIRYMLTSVPLISVLISSLIMVITLVLFAKLSIYIYRFGSLNYGNKIKLRDVFDSFNK